MRIQFIEPLSQGISRMRKDLFNPLDIPKWFVIGFTAFLAGLLDGGFPGTMGMNFQKHPNIDVEAVLYFPQRAWQWLANHPGWAILIAIMVFLAFVIGIIITGLGSRGKFMFLDNVVHGQARVMAPWYEYKKEGNSFFLCNLIWGAIVLAIIIAYISYCFISLQSVYESSGNGRALIVPVILAGLGFFIISIINLFLYAILKDFVVLIMYKDRISTPAAIQKFLPLFFSQFLYFLGYELFLFCLLPLVIIVIVIAGCCTCCLGFLILMIPYINAVVLLPISYALRAFSIEFLEQFGPEYHIFPRPEINLPPQPAIV
jgi:hypothetical protein